MFYYRIKDRYLLRGWKKLPYALLDSKSGRVLFFKEQEFNALLLCAGKISDESINFLPSYRSIIEKLCESELVEKLSNPRPLNKNQEYKEYPSRYLNNAHWSVTGKCNYKCKHCYMSAPHAKYGELPLKDCIRIVEQLAECGVFSVSLTGGECLVRKDFFKIVDALLANNIKITTVYSNGHLVTENILSKFEERNIHPEFNMSFDGVGWHDWMRGINGAEESVIRAFRLCRERGFPTQAELCLHKGNVKTLRESVNLLAACGCQFLKVNTVMSTGEWIANGCSDYTLSSKEAFDAYLEYLPYYYEDGKPMEIMLGGLFHSGNGRKGYFIPGIKCSDKIDSSNYCVCAHARTSLYITAEGRMAPCMPLSGNDELLKNLPDLCRESLNDALDDSSYMDLIDKRLSVYLLHNSECASCKWKFQCLAGCRGVAMQQTGDYLGKDESSCLIFKGGYRDKLISLMEQIRTPYPDVLHRG
ncbi:MAG: radical SAM protein [Treponema sp.]|nr:radical SAM protein [Treponema sp.]